jgi:hypothetical protein
LSWLIGPGGVAFVVLWVSLALAAALWPWLLLGAFRRMARQQEAMAVAILEVARALRSPGATFTGQKPRGPDEAMAVLAAQEARIRELQAQQRPNPMPPLPAEGLSAAEIVGGGLVGFGVLGLLVGLLYGWVPALVGLLFVLGGVAAMSSGRSARKAARRRRGM